MSDSQSIENLHLNMYNKIFYLLIKFLVPPLNKGYDKINNLSSFLCLNPLMIIKLFFMFQCWIKHSKWNLNQLHCLNKINKVHNRKIIHLLKTYPTISLYFHLPFIHNNCCLVLFLLTSRKVIFLCLLLIFYVVLRFLWSSCRRFVKNMIYFMLFLLALWKVIKKFTLEWNQTFWKFIQGLII